MSGFKSAFFNHKNEMFGKIQNWSVLTCIFVPVATKATAALLTEQEGRRPWLILMKTAHWLFFLPPIRMETPHSWVFSKLANFKAFRDVFHFPVRYSVLHYFKPLYTLCIKRRLGRYSRLCPPQQRFLVLPGDPEVLPGSFRGPADSSRLANLKKIQGRLRIMEHGGILF